MLRIVVFNKGSLFEFVVGMLWEVGYCGCWEFKELVLVDVDYDIEFFFFCFCDIVVYVGLGSLDGGIIGCDFLLDFGVVVVESMFFGFVVLIFCFAVWLGVVNCVEDIYG